MSLTSLYRYASIQQKMLGIALSTALLTAFFTLTFFLVTDFRHQKQTLLEQSRVLSKILAANVAATVIYHDPATAKEILTALKEKEDVVSAYIFTPDHQLFTAYESQSVENQLILQSLEEHKTEFWEHALDSAHDGSDVHTFNTNCLGLVVPIKIDERLIGFIDLHLSLSELIHNFQHTIVEALGAMMIAMMIAMLLARWLGNKISRPLLKLTSSIEQISQNNAFNTRLKVDTFDETGILIKTFNTMLDRLEQHEHSKNALIVNLSHAKWEAERASRAKSEFLSRMSHELRTPLNAIIGFSQLLASDETNPLTEDQGDSINHILKAGLHLLDLISELLDLAAVESGKLNISIDAVFCQDLIKETLELIAHQARDRNIHIDNQLPDQDFQVSADRLRLKQCLLNLLSNAVKYNRPNGEVSVRMSQQGQQIAISVIDSGLGISPNDLPKLFQPFSRFHPDQDSIEGAGIGLLITKHMVEMMGGQLLVTSQPGQGSEFTLLLNRYTAKTSGDEVDQSTALMIG